MKPFRILVCMLPFLLLPLCVLSFISISPAAFPRDSGTGRFASLLAKFDQQVTAFEKASAPRTLVVGRSYASDYADNLGCYNLAFGSCNFADVQNIIRAYCRPEDTVIYVFTAYDLIESNPAKPFVTSALHRKGFLLRQIARSTFAPSNSIPPQYSDSSLGIQHLQALQKLHRNIRFVYHPANGKAPEQLRANNLDFLDLYPYITAYDYKPDRVHLSPRAAATVARHIKASL